MRAALISLPLLALAACQTARPANDPSPMTDQTCIADSLQNHVGQPLSALDRASLPAPTRIIGPGSRVTMDHRPERLNIQHDSARIIQRIYCG